MRARALFALIAVLILLLSSSGCISIHTIKDALLFREEPREVVYWKVTPPPVDVYWEASSTLQPESFKETYPFKVKDGAKWIKVNYKIDLPYSAIGDLVPVNISIPVEPEVLLRLRRPDGEIYWERNFTESMPGVFQVQGPVSGLWTLRVEATGYGIEFGGVEVRDTVSIVVDLYEPK